MDGLLPAGNRGPQHDAVLAWSGVLARHVNQPLSDLEIWNGIVAFA